MKRFIWKLRFARRLRALTGYSFALSMECAGDYLDHCSPDLNACPVKAAESGLEPFLALVA